MRTRLTLALALSTCAAAQQLTVFVHARVFDGVKLLRNQTVVIEGGLISSVGGAKPTNLSKTAIVIDCRGKTLLPGLIDAYGDPRGADSAAVFGVTTFAGGSDWVHLIYDDGFSWGLRHPPVSYESLNDEIDLAHRRQKHVLVEVGSLRESMEALSSAADGLVRIYGGVQTDQEFVKLAVKKKAFVIPVLTMLEDAGGKATGDAVAEDGRLGPFLTADDRARLKLRVQGKPRMEGSFETLQLLLLAHVPILAGDGYGNPGTAAGASLHHELALLVRDAGLTPLEALAAATSVPARIFSLDDRGAVAPGKRADLVLVNGDPTRKIKATRDIVGVWKQGIPVNRDNR